MPTGKVRFWSVHPVSRAREKATTEIITILEPVLRQLISIIVSIGPIRKVTNIYVKVIIMVVSQETNKAQVTFVCVPTNLMVLPGHRHCI
jgi:hypothetical protein